MPDPNDLFHVEVCSEMDPDAWVLVPGPLKLLVSDPVIETDKDCVHWTFKQDIYGLQLSESVAIAPDGSIFDPRTVQILPDGRVTVQRASRSAAPLPPNQSEKR